MEEYCPVFVSVVMLPNGGEADLVTMALCCRFPE